MSAVESFGNVAVGYVFALATQLVVFPLFDMRPSLSQSATIGLIFTVVSLVRSFALRRVFEFIRTRRHGA